MDPVGIDGLRNQTEGEKRDVAADVGVARKRLEDARSRLDVAVAALPDAGGDERMATPALLTLLLGAVTAKQRLKDLEALLAATASTAGILG
jgi:hypothetical protein